MPVLFALLPLLTSLIGGSSITVALGAFGLSDWVALALSLAQAEPSVVAAISALHPAFSLLAKDIGSVGAHHAAQNAWRSRQPQFISGYGPDGGLTEVPNPDYSAS